MGALSGVLGSRWNRQRRHRRAAGLARMAAAGYWPVQDTFVVACAGGRKNR